jgi:hypothetical protein
MEYLLGVLFNMIKLAILGLIFHHKNRTLAKLRALYAPTPKVGKYISRHNENSFYTASQTDEVTIPCAHLPRHSPTPPPLEILTKGTYQKYDGGETEGGRLKLQHLPIEVLCKIWDILCWNF